MGILNRRFAAGRVLTHVLAAVLLVAPLGAQPSREYDLKAAFLYNFAAFVEWPPHAFDGPEDPLVIGIFGHDPFGPVLDEIIAGESVGSRPIMIRRILHPTRISGCHILFISASEEYRMPQLLQLVDGRPILTVGDVPGFGRRGGMIGLLAHGGRVVLEVNILAVESADLVISSKLLRVAQLVDGKRRSR